MPALKKSIRCYSVKRRWTGSCALDRIRLKQRKRTLSMVEKLILLTRGSSKTRLMVIYCILRRQVHATLATLSLRPLFWRLELENFEFSNWNLISQIEISLLKLKFGIPNWNISSQIEISFLKLKSQNLRFYLWCHFANTPMLKEITFSYVLSTK